MVLLYLPILQLITSPIYAQIISMTLTIFLPFIIKNIRFHTDSNGVLLWYKIFVLKMNKPIHVKLFFYPNINRSLDVDPQEGSYPHSFMALYNTGLKLLKRNVIPRPPPPCDHFLLPFKSNINVVMSYFEGHLGGLVGIRRAFTI